MAKQVSLKASSRNGVGRTQARKTRAVHMIPAIIYGSHTQPIPIQVDSKELESVFKHATSENMLVDLTLDEGGKTSNRLAFIQEIQHHPLKDTIQHLDFLEIRANERLKARVAIVAKGEPEGVKTGGGILEQLLRELEVECLPKDLPDLIEVDVSALLVGSNIHVGQIKAPANVTILSHADVTLFSVSAPVKEESLVPSAATPTEPELIKKKKEGEETESTPAAAGKETKPAGDGKTASAGKTEKK